MSKNPTKTSQKPASKTDNQSTRGNISMYNDAKVKIGKYEVIYSGIVNLNSDSFAVEIDDLVFKFNFIKDRDCDKIYSFDSPAKNQLNMNIYNSSGIENISDPIQIGYYQGRKLYITLSFISDKMGENKRIVFYNFLLGGLRFEMR
jgi:hypothetical protein